MVARSGSRKLSDLASGFGGQCRQQAGGRIGNKMNGSVGKEKVISARMEAPPVDLIAIPTNLTRLEAGKTLRARGIRDGVSKIGGVIRLNRPQQNVTDAHLRRI